VPFFDQKGAHKFLAYDENQWVVTMREIMEGGKGLETDYKSLWSFSSKVNTVGRYSNPK